MHPQLSVIIVNYNGVDFLKNCINSLNATLNTISFEIIIIDNNSKDSSCEFIKANFPEVQLIESQINFGFGKGNNEAVKLSKADFLLLINNDTIVLDNLEPVLNFLKSDKTIGALGINMLDSKKKYLPVSGNFPNIGNMLRMKRIQESDAEFSIGNFTKNQYEVDWLSGSFLMMPKKVYEEVHGFDEDYFLYVEDVDLCKRIANLNYKRVFLPSYNYIHFVGFNTSKNPLLVKGYEIYISKHLNGYNKAFVGAALQINKLVKFIKLSLKIK